MNGGKNVQHMRVRLESKVVGVSRLFVARVSCGWRLQDRFDMFA